ncbi:Tex-like N-terminal domain-containing protein [Psychromonas sp. KJ10-10]|uniref:Tex-like N-terminal domain-containing protein n=1 Tax=Psychromonas sp. KJ10-10 TaxID=3391823 RepID=UPI0039B36A3D
MSHPLLMTVVENLIKTNAKNKNKNMNKPALSKELNKQLNKSITQLLSQELTISVQQVEAFISLYDEGNTVPFIARYRKEKTKGLDDNQLRTTRNTFKLSS